MTDISSSSPRRAEQFLVNGRANFYPNLPGNPSAIAASRLHF
ncbi:hypothetical protein [Rhizobium bangladeshense]|nr:hypothetical protein [Rhizobium bangladeshense]